MTSISTLGIVLTLIASFGWGAMDVGQKALMRRVDPMVVVVLLPLAEAPLLALYAAFVGPFILPPMACLPMLGSATLNAVGLFCFMQALHRSPMSLTIPLLSLTPVMTTLLGWAFRHQVPGLPQVFGAFLVVGGALVLGAKSPQWHGFKGFLREPGVPLMLGASVAWSCTALMDQTAFAYGAGVWYAPALTLCVGLIFSFFFVVSGKLPPTLQKARALAGCPGLGLTVAVMGAAVIAVQIESLRHVPAGLNETVRRGLGMACAIVSGRLFFKETITHRMVVAVVILTLGVALVVGVR
ncbi:DMT family transporter [Holophaga foetida]|uniref:DMT family transporter n=1 Tax=Holophaga foetida TaxID=35839 RepID=UPI0002474D83|nr:DMT family transporter [Holophaga foetida]